MTNRRARKAMMLITLLVITGLLVLMPELAIGQASSPTVTESANLNSSTINGRLDSRSQKLVDNTYYNAHPFEGKAGQQVRIDLTSNEFDAYLILLDPNGNKIAEGGSGTGGTDARLVVTLSTAGTYTILATTHKSGESGSYTLSWGLAPKDLQPEDLQLAEQFFIQAEFLRAQLNHEEAFPLAKRALEIRQAMLGTDHPDVIKSQLLLGWIYMGQDRYAEATSIFSQALEASRRVFGKEHPEVLFYLGQLAALYTIQNHYAEAEPLLIEALRLKQRLFGEESPEVVESLNELAQLHQFQGHSDKAESMYRQALELNRRLSQSGYPKEEFGFDHEGHSLGQLAYLYMEQGRYAEAESYLLQDLEHSRRQFGEQHYLVGATLESLARLYWTQGNIDRAVDLLWQVLKIEEHNLSLTLASSSEGDKPDALQNISVQASDKISFHLQNAPKNYSAARLALTAILQRKGRILDNLANTQSILRKQVDPKDRSLLDEVFSIRNQLANLVFTKPKSLPVEQYQYRTQVVALEEQLQQIEREMSRRSSAFRAVSQPVTIEAIQQLIPADTALVELFQYEVFDPQASSKRGTTPRYAAYVLHPQGEPQGIDLGEAKAIDEEAVKPFRNSLQNLCKELQDQSPCIRQFKADAASNPARHLDQKLMQPIRKLLGNTRKIMLSPDSALNLIPFEALVDENNQYLVENYSFTYLTSGRDLLRLQNPSPSKQPPVLIADPNFQRPGEVVAPQSNTNSSNPNNTRSIGLSQQGFPFLDGTRLEVEAIAPLLKVNPLIGSQATEGAVKQANSPEIIHIATHGFFESAPQTELEQRTLSDNPLLLSGLVLAGFKNGQGGGGEDGILTALETSTLNLVGTKLVVLSACNTGLGNINAGEGVYGLRRALVIAGSESQVISLWKVDDNATKDLMVAYYKRLLANEGRSEALRQTQLEMIKSENYQHPYYWAAFIPSGDWKPMGR